MTRSKYSAALSTLAGVEQIADQPEAQQRERALFLRVEAVVGLRRQIPPHERAVGKLSRYGVSVHADALVVRGQEAEERDHQVARIESVVIMYRWRKARLLSLQPSVSTCCLIACGSEGPPASESFLFQ